MRSLLILVAATILIPASSLLADDFAPSVQPAPAAEPREAPPVIDEPAVEPRPLIPRRGITIDVGRVFDFGRGVRVRIGRKQFGERDIEVELDGNRIGHRAGYRLNVRTRDMGDGDVRIQRVPNASELHEAERRAPEAEQGLDVELGDPADAAEAAEPGLPASPAAAGEAPLKAPPVDLGSDSPIYAPRESDGDAAPEQSDTPPPKPGAAKPEAGAAPVDL